MQAMILAAGFGTRLLPYTEIRPKPLFPILNKPLLLITIDRMQRAGFDHIVVNCHYLKEQICDALRGIPGVVVQQEQDILGTGGGLGLAQQYFRDEPLLVSNGDIYHTVDYRSLYNFHRSHEGKVSLALHDYARFNCIKMDDDNVCEFKSPGGKNLLAFTGLHVLDPAILQVIPSDKGSCIIDLYRQMLEEREVLKAYRVDDCFWTDMGTLGDYLALHEGLLKGEIPCWEELELGSGKQIHLDEKARVEGNLRVVDWACVGDAVIGANSTLERSIIWDNAYVEQETRVVDSLVTSGTSILSGAE